MQDATAGSGSCRNTDLKPADRVLNNHITLQQPGTHQQREYYSPLLSYITTSGFACSTVKFHDRISQPLLRADVHAQCFPERAVGSQSIQHQLLP